MSRKILNNRTYTFKRKKIKNVNEFFSKFTSVEKISVLQIHQCGDCTGLIFQRVGQFIYAFIFNLEIENKGCKLTTTYYDKVSYNERQLDLFGIDDIERIENKRIGELCHKPL